MIEIIKFYWIWTWKYLEGDLGLQLIMSLGKYKDFLDLSIKDLTNYLSVCSLNFSGRKDELVARAFPAFVLKIIIIVSSGQLQSLKWFNNL